MSKLVKLLNDVRKDEEGTALLEYTMLLGLIATVVITAAIAVGGWVSGRWTNLCGALNLTC